jgi:hypothetical protein
MHSSARHVADALREQGVTGQVRELPDPAPADVGAAGPADAAPPRRAAR